MALLGADHQAREVQIVEAEVAEVAPPRPLAGGLRGECLALGKFGQVVGHLLRRPSAYTKVPFWRFVKTFFGNVLHEALTNSGKSAERITEECVGKGNKTALVGKVAIITGASNGIGLENARCFLKYGCHVVFAVRNRAKAEAALKKIIEDEGGEVSGTATILTVELSDLTTVKPFVNEFLKLNLPLDYLILNAGIMAVPQWEPSAQGFELMFATNNLSHFLMTELLMDKLKETAAVTRDARILILSSCAGSMCSNIDIEKVPVPQDDYHELADYCVTKAIDAFHARKLQQMLKGTHVYAAAVHPGIIGTGLLRGNASLAYVFYVSAFFAPFRKHLPSGAATTMYCALSKKVPKQVDDGWFFFYNRAPQKSIGVMKPGVRDDLVEKLYRRQLELAQPFM